MKTKTTSKAAFTLVEMLVVIVIISLVAAALTSAIRGAQRAANATKCQKNMKNLHTAVVAYLADRRGTWGRDPLFERLKSEEFGAEHDNNTGFMYPRASSYECMEKVWDGGQAAPRFWECHGWVSWIKPSGERVGDDGKTPWIRDGYKKSHAKDFYYPASTDEKMREAISEGYLFKYVGKDFSTYRCPDHRSAGTGETIHLAYAMNNWFGSHVNPIVGARNTSSFTGKIQPSRMALFIEMVDADPDDTKPEGRKGVPADTRKDSKVGNFVGDSAWDWGDNGQEKGRFSHRMGKQGGQMYCNVVFVDGHVQPIPDEIDASELDEWNGHKDIDEVFNALGAGVF